jgi:hypothetical protein
MGYDCLCTVLNDCDALWDVAGVVYCDAVGNHLDSPALSLSIHTLSRFSFSSALMDDRTSSLVYLGSVGKDVKFCCTLIQASSSLVMVSFTRPG